MIAIDNIQIVSLLNELQLHISEYCFSNVYCFQKEHSYEYVDIKNIPFIKGKNNLQTYLMPLIAISRDKIDAIYEILQENNYILYPIPEEFVPIFKDNKKFKIDAFEKDFDYLYSQKRLSELSGRKLSKKRNLISQFERQYTNVQIANFSKDIQEDAILVLQNWLKNRTEEDEEADYEACLLGIQNYDKLNLDGVFVYVENVPVAFSLGEKKDDIFILHFAKANTTFKGLYQYLSRETAKYVNDVKLFNFEQDLGKQSLKKMKNSYYPDTILKKYTISITTTIK
jgi:uncharacterized protein